VRPQLIPRPLFFAHILHRLLVCRPLASTPSCRFELNGDDASARYSLYVRGERDSNDELAAELADVRTRLQVCIRALCIRLVTRWLFPRCSMPRLAPLPQDITDDVDRSDESV
jgi:hypothetical protein